MTFIEHRCTHLFLPSISQLQLQFFLKPYSLKYTSIPQLVSFLLNVSKAYFKFKPSEKKALSNS